MKNRKSFNSVFLLYSYCGWLERFYRQILWISVFAALIGTFFSVFLYKNLKTDLEELLPENAESVQNLRSVLGRVGGLNHISIVIESNDRLAGRKFAQNLASELRKLPHELVARVEDNINGIRDFFVRNKILYIETNDWRTIEDYIRVRRGYSVLARAFHRCSSKKNARCKPGGQAQKFSSEASSLRAVEREKLRARPHGAAYRNFLQSSGEMLGLDQDPSKLEKDFETLKQKYFSQARHTDQFPEGFFESRDGKTHIVLAFQPGKLTSFENSKKLSEAAHQIVATLNPKTYAPDMQVGFDGDVQNLVEEQAGLVEDLILSSIIVFILVGLVLWLYFRSFVGVFALSASLMAGTAATFGLSYFLVGYLNANTAFLGSIVVGNGINFGIIMLARYFEERRAGKNAQSSLRRAVGFTTHATSCAACAAGLSYLSLIITDFRGFNQFGLIGGLGMALCWLTSFTTLPASLIWFEKRKWIRLKAEEGRMIIAGLISRFVISWHRPLVLLTVISIIVSSFFVKKLVNAKDTLESDFSKLRHKNSMLYGSGFWGKKVDAVFERYLTPTLIMTRSSDDAGKLAESLRAIKAKEGAASPISEIKRVEDFLPVDQAKKLRTIARIQEMLPPKVIMRLGPEDRKLIEEFLPKGDSQALGVTDLPESLLVNFREMDGAIGKMVHVYPRLQSVDGSFWDASEVIRFTERIREAIKTAGVPAAIAGQPPLSSDMISAIAQDGPKATAFAFLAVVALVLLMFPRFKLSRSILLGLGLGVLWMVGLMGAFHLKINFLNFIALPITFGIGVDYAVNIFSRYRMDESGSIAKVIENTGGAVALCSATTIIGYGSLLLAGNQAFVSFGRLAVLGELTCLGAALIALPAVWHFVEERKQRRVRT